MRKLKRLEPLWIAVLVLAVSMFIAQRAPLPRPQFHDEFSYLLACDTFTHGRVTNLAHPLWEFFETFQVIHQPTYMSRYPPLHGLFLALGMRLSGEAIVGVWISTALACAAAWWALRAFVPRRWATLGALLIALHPMMLKWNWCYWGGSAAMIGGCFVLGALGRASRAHTWTTGVALASGLAILLNSRPYEGFVLTVLCGLAFARRDTRQSLAGNLRRLALPLITVLMIALPATGYYNFRITGNPLRFPYVIYEQQYAPTPPLIVLPARSRPVEYRHAAMRDYYAGWEADFHAQRTPGGLIRAVGKKSWTITKSLFSSPILLVPLAVALRTARRDRWTLRMLLIGIACLAASFAGLWFFDHYTAPYVVTFFIIFIQGLRHIRAVWPGGQWIVRGVVVLHISFAVGWTASLSSSKESNWHHHRAALIQNLDDMGGRHLIIVRPGKGYYVHNEWVYNSADIDGSTIVWARDMGEAQNVRLRSYFHDRTFWNLDIDAESIQLRRAE